MMALLRAFLCFSTVCLGSHGKDRGGAGDEQERQMESLRNLLGAIFAGQTANTGAGIGGSQAWPAYQPVQNPQLQGTDSAAPEPSNAGRSVLQQTSDVEKIRARLDDRRRRNNEACIRYRANKKSAQEEMRQELQRLENRNIKLKAEIEELGGKIEELRGKIADSRSTAENPQE